MSDTKPQARRVMAAGGEWGAGMLSETGIRISHSTDTYPGGIRDGDSRVRPHNDTVKHDELPDLNDAATCAVLWGQLRERVRYMILTHGMSGHRVLANVSGKVADDWHFKSRIEAEVLAAAFEWVASLEANNG